MSKKILIEIEIKLDDDKPIKFLDIDKELEELIEIEVTGIDQKEANEKIESASTNAVVEFLTKYLGGDELQNILLSEGDFRSLEQEKIIKAIKHYYHTDEDFDYIYDNLNIDFKVINVKEIENK